MNILVIGLGNVYQSSYRSHVEKAASHSDSYVVACDVNVTTVSGNVVFVQCPIDWNEWDNTANRKKILGQPWDVVMIATTPQSHSHIAGVVAKSQIELQNRCVIVIEKPVDLDIEAAYSLESYLESNDSAKLITLRVIDHYRGKWAIGQAEALLQRIKAKSITRAMFVSYEQNEMWKSLAFQDGYLIEHGMHGLASLDKAVGIKSIRRNPNVEPEGARYDNAPTKHDTWARAEFLVTAKDSDSEFPFVVAAGKAVGSKPDKWLRVDGTTEDSQDFALWADIDGKSVKYRISGRVSKPDSSSAPDGYDNLLPDILAGNIDEATVPFASALAWMKPLMEASEGLRQGKLPSYTPGDYPLSAKQVLDELKEGMP